MTDVKLVWDFHTTNIDQLHAYLRQHEFHANEVRLMYERNSDPLSLVATHQLTQSPYQTHQNPYQNSQFQPQVSLYQSPQYGSSYHSQQYSTNQSSTPLSITYPSNDYQSSVHHNVYSPQPSIPQLKYAPTVNQQPQQPKFPQLDSGLTVPVFKQGDDPIDAINHMMSFLSAIVTSRYPTTNNQLRNSSNPRQQATIKDGRVTLQPIQGRKFSFATGTTRTYTPGVSGSNSGKQRPVICYNCKGEGHMSKQCIKPKRKQDDAWFNDKVLLVQAQANGQILHEEELVFLADPEIAEGVKPSTSASGSQPSGNTKKDKIQRPPSSTQNNKVEAYPGTVKASLKNKNCVVKPKGTAIVQHSKLNANSELICVKCNGYSGCSKHMTEDRSQLASFVSEFLGTVKFGNDHVENIIGYEDYQIGNVMISSVLERSRTVGKSLVDNAFTTHTIAPKMLKIDVEPLAPRLLNNRTAHFDYLWLTQEQDVILREVVKQEKS
uniref:Integrase, catalytic region, zinc finger, CCHC-type, peptidase aspartic, catalytic n=1 Tax=Tanacetum cinerariifolium TaxID=118510 RepID=A0A6L2K372_TANCI|nr:integrase, catalytic region, zinc finger, CCHC-type, peptidase aspartic, catalytic [Tanacetum cinerariifolium]